MRQLPLPACGVASGGLVVDLFSGFGGVSLAIRDAIGRDPDVAINHWDTAVAVHAANHPKTRHLHGNVWHYAPRDVVGKAPVWLLWASPSCVHFSKAKSGPLDRQAATKVRALAWVVTRWARDVRPSVCVVENVGAFKDWGPLNNDGRPDPARRGATFRKWVRTLEALGYVVEWRELRACDYGAPTSRTRLFIVARCDGLPIVWPSATHGPGSFRAAEECIDWSIPAPSIFERTRPLSEATNRRIARGLDKFVFGAGRNAYLIHVNNGERVGQAPRIYDIDAPLSTVVAGGIKHALVAVTLVKHYGGNGAGPGIDIRSPLDTITTQDHHALVTASTVGNHRDDVRAFMERYGVTGTIAGHDVADIGMRLLVPRELARAHDFDDSLALERDVHGNPVSKTAQTKLVGNSVPRRLASAVVAAQLSSGARRAA